MIIDFIRFFKLINRLLSSNIDFIDLSISFPIIDFDRFVTPWDITRWREDMNFMFEWQEQYLTSERSERVRYCSCHENLKFISSRHRVMFFFIIWRLNKRDTRNQFNKSKPWRHWAIWHSQRCHTKNTPLGSRMKWRMESTGVLVPSKTLSSI